MVTRVQHPQQPGPVLGEYWPTGQKGCDGKHVFGPHGTCVTCGRGFATICGSANVAKMMATHPSLISIGLIMRESKNTIAVFQAHRRYIV